MENKKITLVLSLIFLVFLTSCAKYENIFIDNGVEKIKIKAEVADTQEKMEKGLMFRKHLGENKGMFFAFEQEGTYAFWMKNTLMPLDIIFISQDFKIVEISHAEPCTEEPCKSYQTTKYAKYILEVNGNFTTKNGIEVGNAVIIE
ncbi:MAG: DUF192 domain-containing protein [Nanoarchaeota archaeon]